ncbi:NOP protein chaperone 1 [Phodopus roborovskii]|uniref:D10Wsu102e protein n=1 Tax=Phodopus roborovskii TaxID=109678 RepID=A0AAV0A8A5_PHORO|nr:NOP protein chaperone 1 [Phodopus roborovskii]CAH7320474.1 D10Wsu102e [Phodopus roborovskii]
MELPGERVSGPTASPSSGRRSQVTVSTELLTAGSEGSGGIWNQLLISSKPHSRKTSTLQTVRVQRSPLLDQVQAFLPQMAQANEKLQKEMAVAAADHFNIENIDGTSGNIIQMDVALFEMNQSDSKEEGSSEESSQDGSENSSESDDEDCIPSEVTIDNLKLPHAEDGRGKIEVLDSPASKKK